MAAKTPIEDLAYELRLLLGAAKIITALESKQPDVVGNNINYFKDSGYLHTRNLYNYFSDSALHDGKISEYVTHSFNLTLYRQWKKPLHQHVLHISDKRSNPNNEVGGVHINTKIPDFAADIEALWQEWISATANTTEKQELQDALTKAQKEAEDDCGQLIKLIDKGSQ